MTLRYTCMLILTILTFGVGFSPAFAQQNIVSSADVSLKSDPQVPGPLEEVDLLLNSFVVDLDASRIVWSINGVVQRDGIGAKRLTIRTGDIGEPTFIDARIFWSGINSITKRVQINPGYVDILWESVDSYTPPFYRGKALPTSEGTVRGIALTHDVMQNDQYVYTWRKNSSVDQDQSGFAARTFLVKNTFFEPDFSLSVDVVGRRSPFQAESDLVVPRFDTELHYVVVDTEGQTIPKASKDTFVVGDGVYFLQAHPYYFSTDARMSMLDMEWYIEDQKVEDSNIQGNELLFSPPEGAGTSDIETKIKHRDRVLQNAESQTRIVY